MENDERKTIIRQLLKEGKRLPEIQNYLIKEKSDSITYMELRLLIAEMQDIQLPAETTSKFAVPPPALDAAQPAAVGKAMPATPAAQSPLLGGKTTVEIDSIVRTGAALSGRANFASGAKAQWVIDTYGRVGLDPVPGSSKPTQQDLVEFQDELRRLISEAQGSI